MRKHLGLTAFLALSCVCDSFTQVGAFPNKPMRWVVPFAPGGGTDVVVRPIANKFSERVGQSILYDNPGGGGGVIAVASRQRIAVLPEVPTLVEAGYAGFEAGSWYGLAAPAGTPPAIIALLRRESVSVLGQPDVVARLALDGASPVGNTPQEFARQIRDDIGRWANVIRTARIKL